MAQDDLGRLPYLGDFLAVFAYSLGALLIVIGAISFGFQLVLMPVGLGLILWAAMRRKPRIALASLGGWCGVSAGSWLSYTWGLAPTIFNPDPIVLIAFVCSLALVGCFLGQALEHLGSKEDGRAKTQTSVGWVFGIFLGGIALSVALSLRPASIFAFAVLSLIFAVASRARR